MTEDTSERTQTEQGGARTMNIIGAIGWGLLILIYGVALLVKKGGVTGGTALVPLAVLYSVIIGIPAFTALALSATSSTGLRRGMVWANYSLITVVVLGMVGMLFSATQSALEMRSAISLVLGIPLFVVPASINIRALRTLMKKQAQNA